jgi:hypothetical protein
MGENREFESVTPKNEPEKKIEKRNDESDGGGNKKKCDFR